MVRCPRCDGKTERLYPIPREALAGAGAAETDSGRGKACRWCILWQVGQAQKIEVITDTIQFQIYGEPGPWIKHNDKFYCYFKTDNSGFSSKSTMHFYVLSERGEIIKKVSVPEEIQAFYYDLYVRNDSIFTTEYWDHYTYVLDTLAYQWKKVEKADDFIYEDEEYYVTSMDFGEWGGATWFRDKSTGKQYEVAATTPVVNYWRGKYYLTTGKAVMEVSDPGDLKESDTPYSYEKAVGERHYRAPSQSLKGVNIVFHDTSSWWDSKFHIATSFVLNDQLYHLCADSAEAYIGVAKNQVMKPVYHLPTQLDPLRWHYHYRNRILNNHYQTIQFRTGNKQWLGMMEFDGEKVNITYIHNTHRMPVMGASKAESWFQDVFRFYFSNLDNLYLHQIDSIENAVSATDLTQSHKISASLKEDLDLATPRIYRKVLDSSMLMISLYYYTVREKKVEIIRFEWKENQLFDEGFTMVPDSQNPSYAALANRRNELHKSLIEKFGKAEKDTQGTNFRDVQWQKGGNRIILHSNHTQDQPGYVRKIELTFFTK